ncbi:cell surface glycoprotein MUC18-like [Lepisosteus oculatus]|uniref:cell surface glycoprotein MUC18-like n=1 Tax=Lepisosteus oculatus TaxID=7918 RepID=UPI0037175644
MAARRITVLWVLWFSALSVDIRECCSPTIKRNREERLIGEGQAFNLSCHVSCIEPPQPLQWCKDAGRQCQIQLNETTGEQNYTFVLRVDRAALGHSGVYYCQSVHPEIRSNPVILTVTRFQVNVSQDLVEVQEGQAVTINCTASFHHSFHNLTLFWSRGACQHWDAANHTQGADLGFAWVPLTASQAGDYHCCASLPTHTPFRQSQAVRVTVTGPSWLPAYTLARYLVAKAGLFGLLLFTACAYVSCGNRCRTHPPPPFCPPPGIGTPPVCVAPVSFCPTH